MKPLLLRAFLFASIYSFLCILFKLYILQSGLILTHFGFYYSHAVSLLFLIPFLFFSLWIYKKFFLKMPLSGREGFRFLLTVLIFSIGIMSVYHYAEFEFKIKHLAEMYYNSAEYLEFLKKQNRIKPEEYPSIIRLQIESLSSIKAVTSKIFSYLVVGGGSAFLSAYLLKSKNF